jgi:hypothetical protein
MAKGIREFLRLVWAEWSTRVTGSLSAVLLLLGLGISVTSAFGVTIPSEGIIQLATWLLAAICGGQSAFSVWNNERKKVAALQNRLEPKIRLFLYSDVARGTTGIEVGRGPNGEELPYIQVSAEALTDAAIYQCVPSMTRIEHRSDQTVEFREVWAESRPVPWTRGPQETTLSRENPKRFNIVSYDPRFPTPIDIAPPAGQSNMLDQFYEATGRSGEYRYTVHVMGREAMPAMAYVSVRWRPRGYPSIALQDIEIT